MGDTQVSLRAAKSGIRGVTFLAMAVVIVLAIMVGVRVYLQFFPAAEPVPRSMPLDDKLDGVSIMTQGQTYAIRYQNGTVLPADGLAVIALSATDYKANPGRLLTPGVVLRDADFPLVVFFNRTGFDSSGNPVCVRKAADGTVLFRYPGPDRAVVAVVPQRDGRFRVYSQGWEPHLVEELAWYREWMNLPEAVPIPSEKDKEKEKDKDKDKSTDKDRKPVARPSPVPGKKSGLYGQVVLTDGRAAPQLLSANLVIYKGKISGAEAPASQIAHRAKSDKDGQYAVELPEGTYTVAIEYKGRLRGNARTESWPSVVVGADTWVDYEIRVFGD